MEEAGQILSCLTCHRQFSNNSNLKKHVKKFHPNNQQYISSLQLRNKEYKFSCDLCNKHFTHLRNLRFHSKIHGEQSMPSLHQARKTQSCAMCPNYSADKKTIINHYQKEHSISIEQKKMTFGTNDEFILWKNSFETQTKSRFVKESCKLLRTYTLTSYVCHRSGKYIPEGHQMRRLKKQGSNKINALCPASIKVKKNDCGIYEVTVIETHVGHENEVIRLNLTKLEREYLAAKIALNVPFEDILNEVRTSSCDLDKKRMNLLTKKDLHNIKACFNLTDKHTDIAASDSWINNLQNEDSHENNLDIVRSHHNDVKNLNLNSETSTEFEKERENVVAQLQELLDDVRTMSSQAEFKVVKTSINSIKTRLKTLRDCP